MNELRERVEVLFDKAAILKMENDEVIVDMFNIDKRN